MTAISVNIAQRCATNSAVRTLLYAPSMLLSDAFAPIRLKMQTNATCATDAPMPRYPTHLKIPPLLAHPPPKSDAQE